MVAPTELPESRQACVEARITPNRVSIRSSLASDFAAAIDKLGPFEPRPALAVAVSGGADSLALSILANHWARRRDGRTLALVVDHELRTESTDEAWITIERLSRLAVPAMLLQLSSLKHGPALAERARIMRYEVLTNACRQAGILHLLLGHHAADQVETLAMRVLRGSRTHGLAGMSALLETPDVRILRPLLRIEPALLRSFLKANGHAWIEDPSNHDMRATRSRLRRRLTTVDDTELLQAISIVADLRSREEAEVAAELADRAAIRPEGVALLSPGRISSAALSSLIRTIGGADYPPNPAQINGLAAQPRPATLAGVRILKAGRFGNGLLIVREERAAMERVDARADTVWDHRFRLIGRSHFPAGATIGKLGSDAAHFRGRSNLPSAALRTIPAIRFGKSLAAVPHLGYVTSEDAAWITILFNPPRPAAGPCFVLLP